MSRFRELAILPGGRGFFVDDMSNQRVYTSGV